MNKLTKVKSTDKDFVFDYVSYSVNDPAKGVKKKVWRLMKRFYTVNYRVLTTLDGKNKPVGFQRLGIVHRFRDAA